MIFGGDKWCIDIDHVSENGWNEEGGRNSMKLCWRGRLGDEGGIRLLGESVDDRVTVTETQKQTCLSASFLLRSMLLADARARLILRLSDCENALTKYAIFSVRCLPDSLSNFCPFRPLPVSITLQSPPGFHFSSSSHCQSVSHYRSPFPSCSPRASTASNLSIINCIRSISPFFVICRIH